MTIMNSTASNANATGLLPARQSATPRLLPDESSTRERTVAHQSDSILGLGILFLAAIALIVFAQWAAV